MDVLLFLLGAQTMLIGAFLKTSRASGTAAGANKGTVQPRGVRVILLVSGAALIILGILFRMRRYGLL